MTEPTAGGAPGSDARCPWCSAPVTADVDRCPSCGAALRDASETTDGEIPGVTQVDPVVGLRRRVARPNRLVGWLADVDTEPDSTFQAMPSPTPGRDASEALSASGSGSVAPPSDDVRREMRRLELDALKAELEARQSEVEAEAALQATSGATAAPDAAASSDAASEAPTDATPTAPPIAPPAGAPDAAAEPADHAGDAAGG